MTRPPLRILFAGTPDFAAYQLQTLLDSQHQIIGVYTQPDRPAGRGRKLTPSPVKALAMEHDISIFQPVNFKDAADQQQLADLKPDLMVVVAYGLLLPQVILDTPRLGCINIHASLLPRWRGAAPIQRAIAAGDDRSGVTIMQMDAGLDTGDMLVTVECPILPTDTASELHDRLQEIGGAALIEAIDEIANGTSIGEQQDDKEACYAHKLRKKEAHLDFSLDASSLELQVRAFNPWPVSHTELGSDRVRIWEALAIPGSFEDKPGTIIHSDPEGIDVSCGKGALRLLRLQFPGAKSLSAKDILNSRSEQLKPGQTFS